MYIKGNVWKRKYIKRKIYENGNRLKKDIYLLTKKSTLNNKEGAIRSCSIRVLLLKYYLKSFFLNTWNLFLDNRDVEKAIIMCY